MIQEYLALTSNNTKHYRVVFVHQHGRHFIVHRCDVIRKRSIELLFSHKN